MTELEASATRFVSQTKGQWAELVRVARKTHPRDREATARAMAEASGIGKSNLVRKIEAIHAAIAEDYSDDAIISMGQKRVLGKFVEAKKRERTEELVFMRFGVSPELKEAFLQTMWRIGKVLKIKTQEQVLEFINSVFVDMDEEMIKAQAGEQSAPSKTR